MTTDTEKIEGGVGAVNAPAESVIGKQEIPLREVDGALAFLRNETDYEFTELDEKKLLRKIDFLIMPLLFGVYVLQCIDKSLSK
jgi:hypothetical protein